MSKWTKKGRAPEGYDYIQPVMDALESELRERMNEPHEGKRQCESLWPVHQINWQRSRYVYDMFYKYHKIDRKVYDYCLKMKLADANLIAKWKKPGYERLCSTFAINPKNYNYGTVSICRVPKHQLSDDQIIQEKHSGCRGCASGPGGYHNIFGNKYGQYLARIQIEREAHEQKEKDATIWASDHEEQEYYTDEDSDTQVKQNKKRKKMSPIESTHEDEIDHSEPSKSEDSSDEDQEEKHEDSDATPPRQKQQKR